MGVIDIVDIRFVARRRPYRNIDLTNTSELLLLVRLFVPQLVCSANRKFTVGQRYRININYCNSCTGEVDILSHAKEFKT